MINSDMKLYTYYLLDGNNSYGQPTLIQDENNNPIPQGEILININTASQSITENIRYTDVAYLGLTLNKDVNDKYVIKHEDELLKVKYVNTKGRYTQVFLGIYE